MATSENNAGVQTATSTPGMMSALSANSQYGISDPTEQLPEVSVTGGLGSGGTLGSGIDPALAGFNPTLDSVGSVDDTVNGFTLGSDATSGLTGGSSLLSSAIGALTGGSGFGGIAAIGGEAAAAAYGLSEAKSAQAQANAQAQQLLTASSPFLQASQTLLQQYQSQTLNPADKQYVDFMTQEGQNVIDSGAGLKQIATQQLGQFASGQLLPADQLQLDQNTAAQKQQLAQKMSASGTTDSSIMAAYSQQINNQAQIQKQTMLNNYFTTGNTAYNSWLSSTQEGAALKTQGAQYAQTAFQDMMQNSLGLAGVGMSGLTQAIGLEIQSDNELSQSVSTLMSNLASAFAYTVAGGGSASAKTTGASGTNLLNSIISGGKTANNLTNNASNLLNSSFTLNDSSQAASAFSDIDASTSAAEASDLSDILGFSSAGGGAAAAAGGSLSAIGVDSVSELSSVSDAVNAGAAGGGAAAEAGGLGSASTALSVAGGALSLYNEINTWQSGATGKDALSGAETGAAIGTAIMPGIGTAIGAIGGAIAGGISSLFGSGKTDPENANFNNYTQAYNKATAAQKPQVAAAVSNPYVALAGYFDLKTSQVNSANNPIYKTYGRMGEEKFTNDLVGLVNSSKSKGQSADQTWSTVQNWMSSMGTWNDPNAAAMTSLIQNMTGQIYSGTYKTNFKAVGGQQIFSSGVGT